MKVWFGCTTLAWKEYREYYFLIRNTLVKNGAVILYDWIDYADEVAEGTRHNKRAPRVYEQVVKAITESDIVVIENTVPNFSTSHQINFALQRRKPALVLRLYSDKTLFSDSYIESIKDPNLTIKTYDLDSLDSIIKKFIKFNSFKNIQGRYNIVLESKQKYYLDWLSNKDSKSRSQIIRDLIDKEILLDKDFEKYLDNI